MLTALRAFAGSMAGRIFAVLIMGMAAAALVASLLAGWQRGAEMAAARADRIADRVVLAIGSDPPPPGTHVLQRLPAGEAASALTARLSARLSGWRSVTAVRADPATCAMLPPPPPVPPAPGQRAGPPSPDRVARPVDTAEGVRACYAVRLVRDDAAPLVLAVDAPPEATPADPVASPIFLAALACAVVALALIVARMAARPIARLGVAAERLAADLGADPLVEDGPDDVRRATAAFNDMQVQLRRTLEERTYMLAAISHDLRSPLTRMRLRLDGVADAGLRERLIADAQAMTALIEEGLELARLSREPDAALVTVDLGALVASLCEDAEDVGQAVTFTPAPRIVVRTQPDALARIVGNLIDNALLHGGSAAVRIAADGDSARVVVADRGPGIPAEALERVFDPFRRLDAARTSGKGSGLGLTISRLLARRIGCTIALANRDGGGLEAVVRVPLIRG